MTKKVKLCYIVTEKDLPENLKALNTVPARIMAPVRDIIEREVKNSVKRTEPVVKRIFGSRKSYKRYFLKT